MEKVTFEPLTSANWHHFETLFGPRGACGGCWCMYFRMAKPEWEVSKGKVNKEKKKALVESGKTTGIIALVDGDPAGWCALSPREEYVKFESSRTLKPIDNEPVWSIPCFYIGKNYRGKGLSGKLIRAAMDFAKENNIRTLEAYPLILGKKTPDTFAYYGVYSAFEKAGFTIVRQQSANRPMVRYNVSN